MNRSAIQKHARMGFLAAIAAAAATLAPAAEPGGDVGFVAKGDTLPNEVVRSKEELARVQPLLNKLPDEHRLRIEFVTVPRSATGYDHDIRYVRQVTTVEAKGMPDGQEVTYEGWSGNPSRTATYQKGVQEGLEEHYDVQQGTVTVEIPWVKGKIHGVKRRFQPNGQLASETPYVNGQMDGPSRSFDRDGKLIRVVEFSGGERHGNMTDYWPENPDVIAQIVPYRKGKVHGVAKAFYLNGKPKSERTFKENRQHGIEKHYAADGSVAKTISWIDGREVPAETVHE